MTKKLAFFVEGQTERVFVQRLISELAGNHNVDFEVHSLSGGVLVNFESTIATPRRFQVLLFDCQNDEKVKSMILERYAGLAAKGYSLILGLRDLFPGLISDLPRLEEKLNEGIPVGPPEVRMHIAVAEVEAWFLQERLHFSRIDPRLDHSEFKTKFGFDPEFDSAEDIQQPSALLRSIYNSVGKTYRKKLVEVERTVSALDFAELCFDCAPRIPRFEAMARQLDGFFA